MDQLPRFHFHVAYSFGNLPFVEIVPARGRSKEPQTFNSGIRDLHTATRANGTTATDKGVHG